MFIYKVFSRYSILSDVFILDLVIRQIVREEVAMAIGEVVNELKQPSLSSSPQFSKPKPKKKIVEKKQYSSNSVLNEILNVFVNNVTNLKMIN